MIMDYVAVTLSLPEQKVSRDLLLPLDIPQYMLVDSLVDALDLMISDDLWGYLSVLEVGKKKALPLQGTLRDVGVKFGQFLALEFKEVTAKATLICLQGPEFELTKEEMLIGCSSNVDVDLRGIPNQEYVSGRHAKMIHSNDGYYLMDLESTNGTKVNGKVVPANNMKKLEDEDEILLGASENNGVRLVLKIRR
jgi:hypothetical protein